MTHSLVQFRTKKSVPKRDQAQRVTDLLPGTAVKEQLSEKDVRSGDSPLSVSVTFKILIRQSFREGRPVYHGL